MTDRLAQLQKMHEADPADPFCTYGIALEHAKAERADDALAWLDKTLALDADYCYAYFQKGRLLAERGQTDAARQTLRQGLSVAQRLGDEKAASELGSSLQMLG